MSVSYVFCKSSYEGMSSWYHPHTLSLAGAGYSLVSTTTVHLNPAALQSSGRTFSVSMVRYPAEIGAESVSLLFPIKNRMVSVSVNHLGYGIFEGKDEDNTATEDYSSADTWIRVSTAWPNSEGRIKWGYSSGLFISQLESYQAIVWSGGVGGILHLPGSNSSVGICIRNTGVALDNYTDAEESLPVQAIISGARRLAYLPLELCADAVYFPADETAQLRLGGVFTLPGNFKLRLGTTSLKFDQKTNVSISSDFLADTGMGLSYSYQEYSFDLGVYLYGPGGWASGLGFGLKF